MYTLSQLRRQFEALKRKYARQIAAAVLRSTASEITRLWEIAIARKQPKPSPLLCIQEVVKAGFRLTTFNKLHAYLEDRRRYGGVPEADEIINRLLPPGKRVELDLVLPNRF